MQNVVAQTMAFLQQQKPPGEFRRGLDGLGPDFRIVLLCHHVESVIEQGHHQQVAGGVRQGNQCEIQLPVFQPGDQFGAQVLAQSKQ